MLDILYYSCNPIERSSMVT